MATDAVPRISKELSIDCEVIDSIDTSQLEGVVCSHPMDSSRTMKLYPAAHATADKGTGIVHTAPAHGAEDFQVAQEYSLLMVSVLHNFVDLAEVNYDYCLIYVTY